MTVVMVYGHTFIFLTVQICTFMINYLYFKEINFVTYIQTSRLEKFFS